VVVLHERPARRFILATSFFDLYEAARAEMRLLGCNAAGDALLVRV
jgi:hypothetical protein